ncbi:LysR family transcriptional regulator [Methylobacterium nodulans]|uniref:Transcriptional regulator, LysR family n=1 Tax=Methylobacterium nodulans (strain LMG 21967 / CNCM I-2342 / ORS 2060) TaxID=460265 RepID=B8IGS0_METNO|nr:LysR family transcriptional regulator [Methylobacterium nodulans]ACL57795.1 transcriptional regulator, LysR family [Methylobacterium nodulans ORS 2060]
MANPLAWDDFRLVKAIADQRGLAPAAERLGINPSTAFRRLGQMEAALGTLLFERHRAGYAPTPAGEEMVRIAARMEDDVAAFSRKLDGQLLAPSGELRVTTADSLFNDLLAPIIARFCDRYPEVRVDVVLSNQPLNLSKRDADVALRATDGPPDTLVGRRLATIAWALYGRAEDGAEIPPGERRWVSLAQETGAAKVARYVAARADPARVALRLDTVVGLVKAVEAGIGIAPLACLSGDRHAGLMRLSPPEPDLSAGLWLLTHADLRHSARVRVFLDFVGTEIARLRDLIEGRVPFSGPR